MFDIPEDKQGHMVLGFIVGLAFANHLILAILTVILVAFGKELYDYLTNRFIGTKHGVEALDILATMVGGGLGIVFSIGLDLTLTAIGI